MRIISSTQAEKIIAEADRDEVKVVRVKGALASATIRPSKGALKGWEFTISARKNGDGYALRRRRCNAARTYVRPSLSEAKELAERVFANW